MLFMSLSSFCVKVSADYCYFIRPVICFLLALCVCPVRSAEKEDQPIVIVSQCAMKERQINFMVRNEE